MYSKDYLYIVTGAMGNLGNTIIRRLLADGCYVRGLAMPSEKLIDYSNQSNMELVRGNILDKESLLPLFENTAGRPIALIHTAGLISIGSKTDKRVYNVNVNGTKNIVDLAVHYGIAKLVHISSVHAIPEPPKGTKITEVSRFSPDEVHGCYAKTKSEATAYVLEAAKTRGLNASVIHPSGIMGPYDFGHGHMTQLIVDYMNGGLTCCVHGGYDIVDVRDVAEAAISAVEKGRAGECYICSGHYTEIVDMLWMLHEITGRRPIRTILPTWFAKMTAPLAETYYKIVRQTPLFTSYSLFTINSNSEFDNSKAKAELGFAPRPLSDTLYDEVAWLNSNKRFKHTFVLKLRPTGAGA